jgi:glycosyltransferase involved in cell wall biosynthesis
MDKTLADILILFGSNSDLEWGRAYQLATAFHELGCRIVYIDMPARLFARQKMRCTQKVDDFYCCKPAHALPIGKMPCLYSINHQILVGQISKALDRLRFHPSVLWAYTPYQASLLKSLKQKFQPDITVYDCSDERVAMAQKSSGDKAAKQVEIEEKLILAECDVAFTVSEPLRRLKSRLHPNFFHLPNGVNKDHFSREQAWENPHEYIAVEGRKILYTGSLEYWLDFEAIAGAALKFPKDHFFLIGPEKTDTRQLKNLANIHFLGVLPHKLIAQYIAHADICINPIKPTPVTNYSDSMKTLQYLSLGKPVLSIDYGEAKDYDGFVILAKSSSDFIEKLGMMGTAPVYTNRMNGWQQLIMDYSWTTIAKKALEILMSNKAH